MKKISLEEIEEIEEKRICQGKKEFTKFVANPLCKFPITDVRPAKTMESQYMKMTTGTLLFAEKLIMKHCF